MPGKRTKTRLIICWSLSLVLVTYQTLANETPISQKSNLNNFNYPSHSCGKKFKKPTRPASVDFYADVAAYNMAITEYNIKVPRYNKKIKTYKSCINLYIKNGNHDINAIRKQLNTALKEARSK